MKKSILTKLMIITVLTNMALVVSALANTVLHDEVSTIKSQADDYEDEVPTEIPGEEVSSESESESEESYEESDEGY